MLLFPLQRTGKDNLWPDITADDLIFLYQVKLGISYAETARIRGCAPSGVTKRRHRIEKRLGCSINEVM